MRIGNGFDIHRLAAGRKLFLGGVEIPSEFGLDGHSDADALLHALCDSLLGALALGDIGLHFPNTDERYRGIDSKKLLNQVYSLVKEKGYRLVNADIMVICERPKLLPYIQQMRETIAGLLECGTDRISVKATTNEKLGSLGRGEGIAVYAVSLLEQVG
ncbi:MAG: 2-C-methyl-D-erythritol 2,4-cyclodiphosphate synthase [Ignavibacteriaceae bacterium]|nr:2-C-methyl-D-erythritol 2,4-cyclodiphosphate synthase [Ignavibacteriaceae bacterium]